MRESARSAPGSSILFGVCALCIFSAFVVSPPTLNMFWSYSVAGGSFVEKLHPVSYVVLVAWLFDFLVVRRTRFLRVSAEGLISLAWLLLAALLINANQYGYSLVVLNNFFFPLILAILLRRIPEERLFQTSSLFLTLTILQTFVVIGEFVIGRTLLPVVQEQAFFRPAGFAGHPLFAGVLAVLGLFVTRAVVSRYVVSRVIFIACLLQLFLLGARGALLFGLAVVVAELIRPHSVRRSGRALAGEILVVGTIVVAFFVALSVGALDRLISRGLWDENAQSRFLIFEIFSFLSEDEFVSGVEVERVGIYLEYLNFLYIESSFVAQVVLGGIFLAFYSHVLIVLYFIRTIRMDFLFFVFVVFCLVTTLSFSAKGVVPLFFFYCAAILPLRDLQRRNLLFNEQIEFEGTKPPRPKGQRPEPSILALTKEG